MRLIMATTFRLPCHTWNRTHAENVRCIPFKFATDKVNTSKWFLNDSVNSWTKRIQPKGWRKRIHGRVDTTLQWIKNAIYYANVNNRRPADWTTALVSYKNSNARIIRDSCVCVFFFFSLAVFDHLFLLTNVNNVIYVRSAHFAIRRLLARAQANKK